MRPRLHFITLIMFLFTTATAVGTADKKEADNSITPPPAEWTPAKKTAVEWVDEHQDMLIHISDEMWKYAEPGMLEYKSAKLLEGTLEEFGFAVERGVAGMPTAFTARYGTGKPVIGILAEYDALGGLSQKAIPEREAIIKGGPGHGCGHNIFGAGSVGAAIAVAQAIKDGKAKGTVILYGTPNEEGVVGKAFMARDGLFDEMDACLHWHPGGKNRVGTGEGGNDLTSFMVAFYGRTAHSGGAPWKGHSALDAVELMGVMTNYFREHLHPSYRIHYVILEGGRAPNVVPDYAKAWFYLRGGTREMVDMMYDRMQKIAEAAAMATNTEKKIRLYTSINHTQNNTEGAKVMHANLQLIGAPVFTEEEQAFARKLQKALEAEEKGLSSEIEPLEPPTKRDLDKFIGSGSSDVAEASLDRPHGRIERGHLGAGVARPPLDHRRLFRLQYRAQRPGCCNEGAGFHRTRHHAPARHPSSYESRVRRDDGWQEICLFDSSRRRAGHFARSVREPGLGARRPGLPGVVFLLLE